MFKVNEKEYHEAMLNFYTRRLNGADFDDIFQEAKELTMAQRNWYIKTYDAYMLREYKNRGDINEIDRLLDNALMKAISNWMPNRVQHREKNMSVGMYIGLHFKKALIRYLNRINGVTDYYAERYMSLKKNGMSLWASDMSKTRDFICKTFNTKYPDKLIAELRTYFPNPGIVYAELTSIELIKNVQIRFESSELLAKTFLYLYTNGFDVWKEDDVINELTRFYTKRKAVSLYEEIIHTFPETETKLLMVSFHKAYHIPKVDAPKDVRTCKRKEVVLNTTLSYDRNAIALLASENNITLYYAKVILSVCVNGARFFETSENEIIDILIGLGKQKPESTFKKIIGMLDKETFLASMRKVEGMIHPIVHQEKFILKGTESLIARENGITNHYARKILEMMEGGADFINMDYDELIDISYKCGHKSTCFVRKILAKLDKDVFLTSLKNAEENGLLGGYV